MAVRQARAHVDPDSGTAVGARIRSLRLDRGLSQAQVAEGMLSASYVSLVESGRRQPAIAALTHIADRLGVDTGFLRDGIDAEARRRARLALGRADAALSRGDVDDAYARYAALEGSPGLADEQLRQVRMGRAHAAERRGDLEDALRLLAELADDARRSPAVHPWMDVAQALCRCYREAGDLDLAISTGEEAMRHADDLGLESSDEYVRLGCTVLAAYQERGDLAKTTLLAADLIRTADALGAPQTRGAAYWNASLVAETRGEIGQALVLVDRAVAMFGESDDRRNLARLRVTYAWLLLQQSPPEAERALELLDGTRGSLVEHGGPVDVSSCDTERARALLALGRLAEARESAEQSLAGLGDQPRIEAAKARLMLGRVLHEQSDLAGCVDQCTAAGAMLESMGATRQAAAVWRELGDIYRDIDRTEAAIDAYDRALRAVRIAPVAVGGLPVSRFADGAATGLESDMAST